MAVHKKISLRELREKHGATIDPDDVRQRTRYERTMDNLYTAGLKLEEANISDVARGTAAKAAIDYADRTGGKAVTPVDVTTTVTYKTTEEHLQSARELISRYKQGDASKPN